MKLNIESYLLDKPLSSLYIRYDKNNLLEFLAYDDDINSIRCSIKLIENYKHEINHYWEIDYNLYSHPVKIISGNITLNNIKRLQENHKTILRYITYDTAKDKDENTYSITINKLKNKELTLSFDSNYILLIDENEDYNIIKVKNNTTNKFESMHYIDNNIYIIYDYLDNSESIYINDTNIKYDFHKTNLSISNYLQYHQPFRITNYETDKQYIMEYDEYGIMKSMIDISNPNVNLCTYYKESPIIDTTVDIYSIHPNIYNSFDIYQIDTDFMNSDILVLESFSSFFPIQSSSYKRYTIIKENLVVD